MFNHVIINYDFLIIGYFVGLFVDWVFQWDWQAQNKSKWGKEDNWYRSMAAVCSHSLIWGVLTTFFTFVLMSLVGWQFNGNSIALAFNVLTISHVFIDTRTPVRALMRFKGMKKEQINDYEKYGFMHIGLDHRLHELVLLILAFFVR